jgi:hypothetical protein
MDLFHEGHGAHKAVFHTKFPMYADSVKRQQW